MPSVSVTDGSNKIFIIFPKLMLDTNESMSIFLSSFDRKIIPENRNKYKPFHITYKEVMQFETYIYFKTYTKRRWKSYF